MVMILIEVMVVRVMEAVVGMVIQMAGGSNEGGDGIVVVVVVMVSVMVGMVMVVLIVMVVILVVAEVWQ